MRFTHGWDPVQLLTWTMVSFSTIITMWQGWDCTRQYLAQKIRVEEKLVGIADLPPIQLSICKIFGIGNLEDEDVMESLLHRGTVPIFARTTDDFWNKLDRR